MELSGNHPDYQLEKLSSETNCTFFAPPLNLCTDNGAMIAWAGYEKYNNEGESDLNFKPIYSMKSGIESYYTWLKDNEF